MLRALQSDAASPKRSRKFAETAARKKSVISKRQSYRLRVINFIARWKSVLPYFVFFFYVFGGSGMIYLIERYGTMKLDHVRTWRSSDCIAGHDYWAAVFFVAAATSTIGFGNVFPCTALGRVFSTGYSVIGVPMVVFVLSNLGTHLCQLTTLLYVKWKKRSKKRPKPSKKSQKLSLKMSRKLSSAERPLMDISTSESEMSSMAVNLKDKGKMNGQVREPSPTPEQTENDDEIETPASIGFFLSVACISSVGLFYYFFEGYNSGDSTYYTLMTFLGGDLVTQKFQFVIPLYSAIFLGFSMLSLTISLFQINIAKFICRVKGHLLENIKKQISDARLSGEDTSNIDVDQAVEKALASVNAPWWIKKSLPKAEIELLKESVSVVVNKKASSAQVNIMINRAIKMKSDGSTQIERKVRKSALSQSYWKKETSQDPMDISLSENAMQSEPIEKIHALVSARFKTDKSVNCLTTMLPKFVEAEPELRTISTEAMPDTATIAIQSVPNTRTMANLALVQSSSPGSGRVVDTVPPAIFEETHRRASAFR